MTNESKKAKVNSPSNVEPPQDNVAVNEGQLPQIPAPQHFNPLAEDWIIYQERLEQYMVSQNITNRKRRHLSA